MLTQNYIKTDKRIEIKEVFKISQINMVYNAILLSKFLFYNPYPGRRINSIYFEDSSYSSLTDSIEGNSKRTKKRIRWYGKQKSVTNATLEIKKKNGHISWKLLYKDNYFVDPKANDWSNFIKTESYSEKLDFHIHNLEPKSIIRYDRDYFTSFDDKVRITIDQNLNSFAQTSRYAPNLEYGKHHSNLFIVEIKVSQENESLLKNVLRELPFSAKRFSKYCESILPQKY